MHKEFTIVTKTEALRQPAEQQFASELAALAAADTRERPPNWLLSPWAVVTYVMGGTLEDGTVISPKYVGNRRLIEIAVATLATDRALLLLGVPGTAKSWVSEHISAAISGDSTLLVQGTAGTPEEAIRYGWNYALLLAKGPSLDAVVPSPVMRGMTAGKIVRVEELTRMPSDVQDTLITILSEKTLPVPELNSEIRAVKGFNIIATANDRDKGVNELSSALKRRFNTVVLPVPDNDGGRSRHRPAPRRSTRPIARAAGRDARHRGNPPRRHRLPRAARRKDGGRQEQAQAAVEHVEHRRKRSASSPAASRSPRTSEAEQLQASDVASGMLGAIVKDPVQDRIVMQEYLETVSRSGTVGRTCTAPARKCCDLMAGTLSVLGIRHHGPGSARVLVRALEKLEPTIVLVEGPPDAADVLAFAAHADMTPPVALLVYEADAPSSAVYYPFATFSPEWQALRWALDKDVPARFIDLPQSLRGRPGRSRSAGAERVRRNRRRNPRARDPLDVTGARGRVRRWRGVVGPSHRRTPRR